MPACLIFQYSIGFSDSRSVAIQTVESEVLLVVNIQSSSFNWSRVPALTLQLVKGSNLVERVVTNSSKMGLLTLLKKLKRLEKETRLLILGLDNAGKTTIVAKYCLITKIKGFQANLWMRYLQHSDLILLL